MISKAVAKIYAVVLKHQADMSSMTTQSGVAIFGTVPDLGFDLDGYVAVYEAVNKKFAAILSEDMQDVIDDEITEDWLVVQMRKMVQNPIGTPIYRSVGSNIYNLLNVVLDGYGQV